MEENTKNIISNSTEQEEVNTHNIFEDFENDLSLKDEINKAEESIKKDNIYYIKIIGSLLKYLNIFLLLTVIIFGLYIYIQKNETLGNKTFLNPFCNLLVGENGDKLNSCSSVSYLINSYKEEITAETNKQYNMLLPLLEENYNNENFLKSKNVLFILDETSKKINPIKLLEEFDRVKKEILNNEFGVQCNNIKINGNFMDLSCSAYSQGHENIKIIGGDTIKGTSISVASSFYKNIDNEGTFKVINKQTEFSSNPFVSEEFTYFTNETKFNITLFYNNKKF